MATEDVPGDQDVSIGHGAKPTYLRSDPDRQNLSREQSTPAQ